MWMQECPNCVAAKSGGLQVWMRHLTEEHVLPSEWPSDRAARLTGPAALKPYTTITESKKKRRKDSIPRPLNSFMLFAQHIRRNVLRVFSDASNSVISQQLGDLWRTVPLRLRNQYDDEANRLVKIHQLEFPNYKYQPKKRVPVNNQNTTSSGQNASGCFVTGLATIHSTTSGPLLTNTTTVSTARDAMETTRLVGRSQPKDHHDMTPNMLTIRPRLNGVAAIPITTTYAPPCSQNLTVESSAVRVISPSKGSVKAVYARLEPKRQNSLTSTTNSTVVTTTNSHRSTIHSLSSVLPPLLTPYPSSGRSAPVSSTSYPSSASFPTTDPFHIGSCDSAYASGINSSSSSSASSPAVGDLLSPAKSLASATTASNGTRSSPIRRKIQLIPLRPHSQQQQQQQPQQTSLYHSFSHQPHPMPQLNEIPTRQRFFSAHNGSTSPFGVTSPLAESPTTPELVYFMPSSNASSCASSSSSSSNSAPASFHAARSGPVCLEPLDEVDSAMPSCTQPPATTLLGHVSQSSSVLTPVYVKLEPDSSRPNEELIIALPPGTTVIQTVGNLGQMQSIPIPFSSGGALNFGPVTATASTPTATTQTTSSGARGRVFVAKCATKTSGSGGSFVLDRTNGSIQFLQSVKLMSVVGRTVQLSTASEERSPTAPYSPNPPSSVALSPLHPYPSAGLGQIIIKPDEDESQDEGRRRIVGHTHIGAIDAPSSLSPMENQIPMTEAHYSPFAVKTTSPDRTVYRPIPEGSQFEMEVDQPVQPVGVKMEQEDEDEDGVYLASDTVFGATMLDGSVFPWSQGVVRQQSNTQQLPSLLATSHSGLSFDSMGHSAPLPPLTVDVLKSSPSLCPSDPAATAATPNAVSVHGIEDSNAGQTPTTEFPMSTEDEQFDTSFDAMMNSIDITTFLPGAFSPSVEHDPLVDTVFDSDCQTRTPPSSPPGVEPIQEEEPTVYARMINYKTPMHSEYLHHTTGGDFRAKQLTQTVLQSPASSPSTISCSPSGSTTSSASSAEHSAYAISPLADLDALDKSSLFMIKPEWPVIA